MNRIDCVNKLASASPWDSIIRLSGTHDSDGQRWSCTQSQCIDYIEQGYQFYVEQAPGQRLYLEVATSILGRKYVRTMADKDTPEQLLRLAMA